VLQLPCSYSRPGRVHVPFQVLPLHGGGPPGAPLSTAWPRWWQARLLTWQGPEQAPGQALSLLRVPSHIAGGHCQRALGVDGQVAPPSARHRRRSRRPLSSSRSMGTPLRRLHLLGGLGVRWSAGRPTSARCPGLGHKETTGLLSRSTARASLRPWPRGLASPPARRGDRVVTPSRCCVGRRSH
jgi:hypothetical protein